MSTLKIVYYYYLAGWTMFPSSCAHFAIMLSSSSNCSYLSNPLPVTPFLPSLLFLKNKIPITNMREKSTNIPIIHSVYWLWMVAPIFFGITLPSSGSVPSAFWEMLNWGAVGGTLWVGVLCLVTWCVATPHTTYCAVRTGYLYNSG
jgi:hypothetical protein